MLSTINDSATLLSGDMLHDDMIKNKKGMVAQLQPIFD
jgi:hypothetical protein